MNAHGYGIYAVLMPAPETTDDWGLVIFDTHDDKRKGGSLLDVVYDSPFDDERAIASVRFLRARWRGVNETLAITARRDLSRGETLGDSVPVEFEVFRLVENEDQAPGWPYYAFDRIDHFTSSQSYCNSDLALARELHLQLPDGYRGLENEDGCVR